MSHSCIFSKFINCSLKNLGNYLDAVVSHVWREHKIAVISCSAIAVTYLIHSSVQKHKRRQKWNSAEENVVILHSFIRGKTIPSLSPYVLKLETYLRMAGIKYEFETEEPMGSKGKSPWITLNGEDYTDSQLIMDFLGKRFDKNFSSSLTDEQKGAATAIAIMTDEHIVWGLAGWRWVMDPDKRVLQLFNPPLLFKWFANSFRRTMRMRMKAQGIGLHTDAEIQDITIKDIKAISQYLGNKLFMMGSEPCEVDCSVFAMMAEFVWAAPGSPYAVSLQSDYRNILDYTIRMKEKFWPDWERCLDNN